MLLSRARGIRPIAAIVFLAFMAAGCASPEGRVAPTSTPPPASAAIPVELPAQAPAPAVATPPVDATPTATPTRVPTATVSPTPRLATRATAAPAVPRAINIRPDSPAPDFKLDLLSGESLSLSDLEGKVVVLNFWSSWCPPCRWEMPMFELAWLEYQGRDVVFVGVAVSDRETDAREFAEKSGVTYAVGVDTTGKIMKDYDVVGLPTTFFIDRRGIVKRKLTNAANEVVLRLFLGGQLEDG